jgi:hypothetical protein
MASGAQKTHEYALCPMGEQANAIEKRIQDLCRSMRRARAAATPTNVAKSQPMLVRSTNQARDVLGVEEEPAPTDD